MAKKVRKIPATLNQFTSEPVAVRRKKKVAGYARVSTDREEQATSYEAQMTYYKTYIEGHEAWEFVGMYSDEGITATNTKSVTDSIRWWKMPLMVRLTSSLPSR